MGLLDKIFKKGADAVIGTVGEAIDRVFTNDEERLAKQAEIQKIKNEAAAEINRHMEAVMADSTKQLELEIENTKSARTREAEFVKATGHIDWMMVFVGVIVMLSFIGITILLFTVPLPEKSEHITINLVGILEGSVVSVIGYYYGSSAGSRIKDMRGR